METKKIIMTLLVLTIILSVATVVLNMTSGSKNSTVMVNNIKGTDTATVGLFVEGGKPVTTNDKSNVGLYVSGTK